MSMTLLVPPVGLNGTEIERIALSSSAFRGMSDGRYRSPLLGSPAFRPFLSIIPLLADRPQALDGGKGLCYPENMLENERGAPMKKVKITVLKTTLDRELAAEYGAEGLTACPMLREGQVFYADYAKPDGLCDEAWKAIYQYVFALAHGAGEGLFYYGDWIRKPGVAVCSCNDGLRPVIFKLEATDEEAVMAYTPVR